MMLDGLYVHDEKTCQWLTPIFSFRSFANDFFNLIEEAYR